MNRRPANGGPAGESAKPEETEPEGTELDRTEPPPETPKPPETLDDLLRALRQQQYELDNTIRHSKASLTDQQGRQHRSKKQLAGLDRVATELGRARTDIDALIAEADRSVQAAAPLVERLDGDVRKAITDGLAAINKEIGDAESEVVTETIKEKGLAVERDRLAVDVAAKQAAHDEAEAALTGLPAALKAAVASLKTNRTGLDAAAASGRPVEAAVLVAEVTREKERVQALRGPAHEKQLLENLRKAEAELTETGGRLSDAESRLIDQRDVVTRRTARRDELLAGRADRIKKLEQAEKTETAETTEAAEKTEKTEKVGA